MKEQNLKTLIALALLASPLTGQPRTERVQFPNGKSTVTLKGTIKGDESVNYILPGAAGERVSVTLQRTGAMAYFNITVLGEDSALFIGSTSGNKFTGALPKAGDYRVDVYHMRNVARRGEKTMYSVTFTKGGGATAPAEGKPSTANAGPTNYDASGKVKCSAGQAKLDRECDFRVIRKPAGAAEIWIANSADKGAFRVLYFSKKIFTTKGSAKLAWQRQNDNWWVSVSGREFYLIPDALIYGG